MGALLILLVPGRLAAQNDDVQRILDLEADAEEGRRVFTEVASPSCAQCHTLRDADADGTRAPDLDAMEPGRERVIRSMVSGDIGAHEAQDYPTELSDQEIADLAAYVAGAADDPGTRWDIGRAVDESPWAIAVMALSVLIAAIALFFAVRIIRELRRTVPP